MTQDEYSKRTEECKAYIMAHPNATKYEEAMVRMFSYRIFENALFELTFENEDACGRGGTTYLRASPNMVRHLSIKGCSRSPETQY
jgi:hypothetical protein